MTETIDQGTFIQDALYRFDIVCEKCYYASFVITSSNNYPSNAIIDQECKESDCDHREQRVIGRRMSNNGFN